MTKRLDVLLDFAAEHRLKDTMLVLLAAWSGFMGVSMFFDRNPLAESSSFSLAFSMATPLFWGLIFAVVGTAPLFTFRNPRDHRATAWMLRIVAGSYGLFSLLAGISRASDGGLFIAVVGFLLPAVMAGILAAVYDAAWRKDG